MSGIAFYAVGCCQYGAWSYIPVTDRGYKATVEDAAQALATDMRRHEHKEHVHVFPVREMPDVGPSTGQWVAVFKRGAHWTLTNGFHKRNHVEQHVARHLDNEAARERGITNVTIRQLPYPESYKE